MSSFELPPTNKNLTSFAVYGFVYLLKTSQASLFVNLRQKLPFTADAIIKFLLFAHTGEAALAFYRSLRAGKSLGDSIKWALSTFVFGFTSLGQQQLVLKRRAY
ncbi:hypothetical protein BCR37DRAFT_397065, partial [Protomyces lactucae-debilis]